MPTSVIGFVTVVPPTTMSPRVRASNPATISSSVLLPQPEGPTTETNSPASMSTLTSFNARNGRSVSWPNVFETRLMPIGAPRRPSETGGMVIARLDSCGRPARRTDRRSDGAKRHFGNQQRLAAALDDPARLVDDLDVEDRDRLRRPRPAVPQFRDSVIDEDRVADEDRLQEFPVVDAEERDRRFAQLAGARPHQPVRVREPEHPVSDAPPELAALRVDVARVQFRVVAGQASESDEIGVGNRPSRAAERHA